MDQLSDTQLKALMGASLTPEQSAAVLGHANGQTQNFISTADNQRNASIGVNTQNDPAMAGIGVGSSAASGPVSFLGGLAKDIGAPFARGAANLVNTFTAATKGKDAADQQAKEGVDLPIYGKTQPIGVGGGSFGADLKDTLAQGTLAASSVVPTEGLASGLAKKPLAVVSNTVKDYLANRAINKAVKLVESTAETMTKGERETAIAQGRLQPTLTGGGKYVPSETEQRAGQLLQGKLNANPVKNVSVVQDEIATRGQEAETHLAENAHSITNQEHADMFATKRAEMEKYSTPSEMKAYDDQVGIFSKQLPGRGAYNTPNYYKALKDYEENVTSRLPKGKEALLSETGSAKLQAAKDVREVVRDMIGDKNPEFKGKMYDLASLYNAKDTIITKAEKVGSFGDRHPYIKKAAIGAGALAGYEANKALGESGLPNIPI